MKDLNSKLKLTGIENQLRREAPDGFTISEASKIIGYSRPTTARYLRASKEIEYVGDKAHGKVFRMKR